MNTDFENSAFTYNLILIQCDLEMHEIAPAQWIAKCDKRLHERWAPIKQVQEVPVVI